MSLRIDANDETANVLPRETQLPTKIRDREQREREEALGAEEITSSLERFEGSRRCIDPVERSGHKSVEKPSKPAPSIAQNARDMGRCRRAARYEITHRATPSRVQRRTKKETSSRQVSLSLSLLFDICRWTTSRSVCSFARDVLVNFVRWSNLLAKEGEEEEEEEKEVLGALG